MRTENAERITQKRRVKSKDGTQNGGERHNESDTEKEKKGKQV